MLHRISRARLGRALHPTPPSSHTFRDTGSSTAAFGLAASMGWRQEALLGLIEVATEKAIYRGVATDEPVEDMIEDEAEGLGAAE
ncbi:hypothetical protein [Rhodobacter capsulatus]|uniref:hypothetical protein n=1 Tax=Rhodobacter capsulatus TaxID=1061 RepID=UPI00402698C5